MIPSIQMNKTSVRVGTIHCIVLISKQEARKLITVLDSTGNLETTNRSGDKKTLS